MVREKVWNQDHVSTKFCIGACWRRQIKWRQCYRFQRSRRL